MSKVSKIFRKLLLSANNIRFSDALSCAEAFGFRLDRVSGSHHIFVHKEIPELLNLQKVKGKAKPYQVKQLLPPCHERFFHYLSSTRLNQSFLKGKAKPYQVKQLLRLIEIHNLKIEE